MDKRKILLAVPHGMCAGVNRALDSVKAALESGSSPVWVLHEIVHNSRVVKDLETRGVHFAEELDEVPQDALLLFSAHGVSTAVEKRARARNLRIADATCPLVKQLHRLAEQSTDVLILIGHRNHPEVEGILGRSGAGTTVAVASEEEIARLPEFPAGSKITLLVQTTFNTGLLKKLETKLRERYPQIVNAPEVCYATANRQKAVKMAARDAELMLIIGSPHSSNSNRLREIAAETGTEALLIESAEELPQERLATLRTLGVGAGASAPENEVKAVLDKLAQAGFTEVRPVVAAEETLIFKLPEILEKK